MSLSKEIFLLDEYIPSTTELIGFDNESFDKTINNNLINMNIVNQNINIDETRKDNTEIQGSFTLTIPHLSCVYRKIR